MYLNQIYRISNKVNGKVYIGLTTQGLNRRKSEHIHRANRGERDHKLYLAIRKYGIENFVFEVICQTTDKTLLPILERIFIAKYNSFNRGYNMTKGGDSVSEETGKKISEKLKGRKITWYDKITASRKQNPNDKCVKEHSLIFPDGSTHTIRNLAQFAKDNDLCVYSLYHTRKKGTTHKGYSLLKGSTTIPQGSTSK